MSTSISALRIEQLKTELRKEEAALSATKTLASELNAACAAEAEAVRLERVYALDIERLTSSLEFLRTERDAIPWQFEELRAKKNKEFKEAENNILRLQVEAAELAKKPHEKRLVRVALEEKIAAHPIYKGIRDRQRDLVEQAAKMVELLFESTLDHWPRVLDRIERAERAEDSLILASIPELIAAGLPEIGRVLHGFFQQAVPHTILSAIPHERTRAFQEIARVRGLTSRGIVR